MNKKLQRYLLRRARCQLKRRTKKWKTRKRNILKERYYQIRKSLNNLKKGTLIHSAPKEFSFIENTNEVLEYFNKLTEYTKEGQPTKIDISKITKLTPEIIILLIAKMKDKQSRKGGISGNAPEDPVLKKVFVESGLYNYVRSKGKKIVASNNKLYKHSSNNQVKGEMAGEVVEVCQKMFESNGKKYNTDNLYNLLVEAMSNTINHADKKKATVNWWLNYFIDEENKLIKYSFIDLGIGIFKSASFSKFKEFTSYFQEGNKGLVKPFLEGKIISSRESDNEISGKGVRQIMSCAILEEFIKFIIITNDLIINVKSKESEVLSSNFDGTLINFEISYR